MALYAIAFLGSTPIGGPIVGWVSQQFGPRAGFALGGIAAILATAAAGWSIARQRESREHRAPDVMAVPAA